MKKLDTIDYLTRYNESQQLVEKHTKAGNQKLAQTWYDIGTDLLRQATVASNDNSKQLGGF